MKSLTTLPLCISLTLSFTSLAFAQVTVWTNGALDQTWSSPANWSAGVPGGNSTVQIGTQPTLNEIGVDTGVTSIGSFAFNNTLTAAVSIAPYTTDSLQVAGDITNNSAFINSFTLPVTAAGSGVWTGPMLFTNNVSLGTNPITLAGAITFTGTSLAFDVTSASTYGRFLGSGTATVAGTTINIGGSYNGTLGDVLDFTTGNFTGATLGTLPSLTSGLFWNTSTFLANGTLSVIPEPQTWLLLAGGLTTLLVLRRRRSA